GSRPQYRRTADQTGEAVFLENLTVGYDYFAVMDIPLIAGRAFSRDRADAVPQNAEEARARTSPPPVVLDRNAARALGFTNAADAVGATIYGFTNGPPA